MFKKRFTIPLVLSLFIALITISSQANVPFKRGSGPPIAASYVGLGDITSFTVYHGLRAFTGAIASAGSQPLIKIKKQQNNHTCDIIVATTGGEGLTGNCSTGGDNGLTPAAFCADGSGATGSISGTTLTVTAGSLNNFNTIYGTGIYIGTQITASAGGGSFTVSPSQTAGSTSITATDCYPVTWYDQTLNNACSTTPSCDLTQNLRGSSGQPDRNYFVINCFGSKSCISSGGQDTFFTAATNAKITPATGVVSFIAEAQRIAGQGVDQATLVGENTDSQNGIAFLSSGTNKVKVVGGTSGNASSNTYSDTPTAYHSIVAVIGSGTNASSVTLDGTTGPTGTIVGSTVTGRPTYFTNYGPQMGQMAEGGFKDNVAWNGTIISNIHANQAAYWGSP